MFSSWLEYTFLKNRSKFPKFHFLGFCSCFEALKAAKKRLIVGPSLILLVPTEFTFKFYPQCHQTCHLRPYQDQKGTPLTRMLVYICFSNALTMFVEFQRQFQSILLKMYGIIFIKNKYQYSGHFNGDTKELTLPVYVTNSM